MKLNRGLILILNKSKRDQFPKWNLDYEGVKTMMAVHKQVSTRKGCEEPLEGNTLKHAKKSHSGDP